MTTRAPAGRRRAVLVYSIARMGVLLGVFAVLFVVGLRGTLLVVAGALGSGLVSYVLLAPQRTAMAVALAAEPRRPRRRLRNRIAASAAAEDAYLDSLEPTPPDRAGPNRTQSGQGD
ncbi:MAG: DUF4229 domain-containing protein [Mycobacteriales bacterium]